MQRPLKTVVRSAVESDRGKVRDQNQDAWAMDSDNGIFLVSDGMGGHRGGDLAARLVAETTPPLLVKALREGEGTKESLHTQLIRVINEVNKTVVATGENRPGFGDMGATLVLLLLSDHKGVVVHKGDSRIYLLRRGTLRQLTVDHSLTQLLIDSGDITKEEEKKHPARGQVTRFMGQKELVEPTITTLSLCHNDRFLLCSDGLTGLVDDLKITSLLSESISHEEICHNLVGAANDAGGNDNITAMVIDWLGETAPDEKTTRRREI